MLISHGEKSIDKAQGTQIRKHVIYRYEGKYKLHIAKSIPI